MLHPQEALLQEARAFQQSEEFAPYRKLRQAAEHRLARLMQLGLRQARYFGRAKTRSQLLLAATVANLTLTAAKVGLMGGRRHGKTPVTSCGPGPLALLVMICQMFIAHMFTNQQHAVPKG
jgi:hypothetical protein